MSLTIALNEEEMEVLFRQDSATEDDGGYQGLLVGLQRKIDRSTGELTLTDQELEQIPRYAFDYGQGGWEDRLQAIFGRHLGRRLRGRLRLAQVACVVDELRHHRGCEEAVSGSSSSLSLLMAGNRTR